MRTDRHRRTELTRTSTAPPTLLIAALLAALAAPATAAVIQRPITIDGDLRDWGPILVNAQNFIDDRSIEQGDPDVPASSDRDLRAFATTWDATNLYFYFRRTFGGNNSVTFLVYVDLNHDGALEFSDRVLRFDFNGSTPRDRELYTYVPAGIADPITGDGVNEPGQVGSLLPATMNSAAHSSGLEVECSIAWASLGVAAGTPLTFHASAASGISLPGHLRDNTDPIDTQYSVTELDQDGFAAGPSPSTLRFAHRIANGGNGADRFDISVRSRRDWTVSVWSDPNGDGDPADGELMACDENGDGDFSDPLDIAPSGLHDSNDNGLPDSGLLSPVTPAPTPPAPPSEFAFVVELSVPDGVPNGGDDHVTVVVRSDRDLTAVAVNNDTAAIGDRIIAPDRERAGAPASEAWFPHVVCNFGATDDVIDLVATSALGWAVELWSDPDGDGDPSDGQPLTDTGGNPGVDTGNQAPGTCVAIVTRVAIPAGAAIGSIDTVRSDAASSASGETDVAIDVVNVVGATMVDPDRQHVAIPGELVYSTHTATNGGLGVDSLDLTAASLFGSAVSFWSDPTCNERLDDGGPLTTVGPLAAFGGSACLLTEVDIDPTFAVGSTETATTTGTSQATALSDSALDDIEIYHVRTYATPLLTFPADTFLRCGTVYAGAAGLAPSGEYRFVWSDPDVLDGPERITSILSADDVGRVDDSYRTQLADTVGTWTVRLQVRAGSSWNDVTPNGMFTFEVVAEDSGAGYIDDLQSERLAYEVIGDTVRIRAEITNDSPVFFYRDSALSFVIFLDLDGDGQPTAGETFIQADGTPAAWADGLATHQVTDVTVHPFERLYHSFSVANVQFPLAEVWSVHMAWETACETAVDAGVFDFIVGCFVTPIADAGVDPGYCPGGSAPIGSVPEPRRTYAWSPATDLDDPTIAQPIASPAATTTYTLTVTDLDTGCEATDDVDVIVHPPAAPVISPVAPATCEGVPITLDAGPGYTSYLWSTGETTQTIDVNPTVATMYTVDVIDGNGCAGATSDTVTIQAPPAADAGPDWTSCDGQPVILGLPAVAGFSYSWSPATGLDDPSAAQPSASPGATTTYTLTMTDDASGCVAQDVVTVTIDPPVASPPLGNVLLETRSGIDVLHHWTDTATDTLYEIHSTSSKDLTGLTAVGSAAAGPEQLLEVGAVPASPIAYYQVLAYGCTPSTVP